MKMLKRSLAVLLVLCMMLSVVPVMAFAADTQSADSDDYRILHLDCGRKYFTKDWIIALINEMAAAGFTHLELAFGNDGLRFLLDDMSVGSYSDDAVTAAIKAGNEAYYDAGDVNELTQAEMDAIITHANSVGISIIPLLNTPGHMDAIITAMQQLGFSSPQYGSSVRTVDVTDTSAVAFTQTLVKKYMDYFAATGCKEFNIGADEYANDTGNPQFSALISGGNYDEFISYINALAEYADSKGMTPMAFNDGIYYNQNTSNGTINENLMVCYWSSGWSGYDVASASYLANEGFDMINTHGDYYFVLTSSGITNPSDKALNFNGSTFMGSTVSEPAGSMFCIWCDAPGIATEQEVAAAARITLRKMAAAMQGTTSYSEEVVAGGFNEDGSINEAETRSWVTVSAENNSDISVSGYELTGVTATEVTNLPEIDGAVNVKAWDITPSVGDTAYTEKGTVKLPVPEGWNTACLTGFYVENGEAVLVKGTYADGCYTFDMPHFSVTGIAELDYNHLIELTVGGSETVIIEGVDLTGNTYTPSPSGIASVTTAVHNVTGSSKLVQVTALADLVSGGKYVLVNKRSGHVLGVTTGSASTWGTTCLVQSDETASTSSPYWTITVNGSNYYFQNSNGSYMTISSNSSNLTTTQTALTMYDYGDGTFGVAQNGYYLNDMGGAGQYAGGYNVQNDAGAPWTIYRIVETQASNGTEVTFTGTSVGETSVTINDEVYKIVVSRAAVNANVVVDGTKTYNDASTNVTVADSSVAEATLSNGTLTITGKTVGTTTVTTDTTVYTVAVTAVDLATVDPLTIEYWITNSRVTDADTNLYYVSVAAADAYSENGVAVSDIVVATTQRENRTIEFWQAKLLDTTLTNSSAGGTEEQDTTSGDDETLAGSAFTRVRYWNGEWQVLTGSTWTSVEDKHQLVAYYLEIINIQNANGNTEIKVNAADWGFSSGENWGYWTGGYTPATVSIQLVYEDGTTNPSDSTVNTLLTKTLIYGYWDGGRGLGTMIFDGEGYEIYKVTAETGDAEYTNSNYGFTITNLTWDGNEETVFEDEEGAESAAIGNPSRTPSYDAPDDNLTWNTTDYNYNNAILIRVYVRAVATDDTLKVVYYDEKFGDTLYEYNILVPGNTIFSNDYFDPDPTTFTNNAERIDVSNAGIQNSNGQTQYFQTDLTKVPEAVGKYRNDLYTYTGSEISEDGKTLYLYYNINTTVLSPNFVVDFGLPITFELSQLLGEGTEVSDVSAVSGLSARYGSLTYSNGIFTYTPTKILQNVDVLSITLTIDGTSAITNVGVTPATTVYYEQTFLTYDSNWTVGAAPTATQKTEILGQHIYNYGYDPVYADDATGSNATVAQSTANGATATFTFTGTGFELYANSTGSSGYVTVYSQGTLNKLYMIDTKLSAGTTDATNQQSGGTYYSLPIISEKDLPYGTYTVQIKQTKGDAPIYIDGVRIINTIDESSLTDSTKSVYYADKEDKPVFYQIRDYVLNAIGVEGLTASDYIDPTEDVAGERDYDAMVDAVASMAGQVYNALGDGTKAVVINTDNTTFNKDQAQDLLDNGPKNELYLYPGQTLVFSVTTDRVMQLGLKAPTGSAKFTLTVDGTDQTLNSLTSTVDMFYKIAEKGGTTHTVSISVSEGVLSVTDLKICDDPNASFVDLTQEDIENALMSVYGLNEEYADAVLSVVLKDRAGRELGTVELTANGIVGESAVFTAEQILAAAKEQLPGKYSVANKVAVSDVEVAYGQTAETTLRAGKIVSLRIVFGNHRGNKQPFEGGWASWLIPEILREEA